MKNTAVKLVQPIEQYIVCSRRKVNKGCVVKRKDGRWMGVVSNGKNPVTGWYVKKYVYGHTKREAKEKLLRVIAEQEVICYESSNFGR